MGLFLPAEDDDDGESAVNGVVSFSRIREVRAGFEDVVLEIDSRDSEALFSLSSSAILARSLYCLHRILYSSALGNSGKPKIAF